MCDMPYQYQHALEAQEQLSRAIDSVPRTTSKSKGLPVKIVLTWIEKERQRQIDKEGWTPSHDDGHAGGQMALSAACYAASSAGDDTLRFPWDGCRDKRGKHSQKRKLVIAGALIVAELERLERLGQASTGDGQTGCGRPQRGRPGHCGNMDCNACAININRMAEQPEHAYCECSNGDCPTDGGHSDTCAPGSPCPKCGSPMEPAEVL